MTVEDTEVQAEGPINEVTQTEPKFDKLPSREALERALEQDREKNPKPEQEPVAAKEPVSKPAAVEQELDPPSEFSAEGKKAWREGDRVGIQREYRRLHDSRTQEITRAQTAEKQAREEAKAYSDLDNYAAEYIKERAKEGIPKGQAMREAFQLIYEFKKGDPSSVKSELKKIGIDLDKPSTAAATTVNDPRLDTIQKDLEDIKKEKEAQNFQRLTQTFGEIFKDLGSLKTRTGDPVYPELLDNSEAGQQFAKELGSLAFNPQFQAGVLRRFPDADLKVVVREGYKYLGGKVSGEPAKVSTSDQKQIDKSRRAAASTPGRVVARNESSSLAGKLSNRAALARAAEERQEH